MKKGFTLIELLVVIAIIAILAAILFPVFARAREKARQTSCLSNVKQLELGIQMYAQDYDEMFPNGWYLVNNQDGWVWADCIYPYVKNHQVFVCPSRKTMSPTPLAGAIPSMRRGQLGYACNESYYAGNDGAGHPCHNPMGRSMAKVKKPAGTIQIVDFLGTFEVAEAQSVDGSLTPPGNDDVYRHNAMANFGFCDGHAKALKPGGACVKNPTTGVYRMLTNEDD